MLLGKVMQQLKAGALVVAHKGARGGYALARSTEHISFTEILSLFEESAALVDCLTPNQDAHCPQGECCDIQAPLAVLNGALMRHLEGLSLATFYASVHRTATKDLSLGRLH
jgi:Rrf2 family protein